ncbi:PREDICTED: V-set and transmembrane domain-containing protein 1 [Condylura cristata]|uniref:V-set and transmembrane domain-containing protein 1 n=1 Tax=Condylura cristata TaxID=143302 RepID=UPI000642920E|nr:PREDICTED: V-set and transmembrane domain-containing protein 1 [Condylura cristata]
MIAPFRRSLPASSKAGTPSFGWRADSPGTSSEDDTTVNLIRLSLAALIVLILGAFLVEAWCGRGSRAVAALAPAPALRQSIWSEPALGQHCAPPTPTHPAPLPGGNAGQDLESQASRAVAPWSVNGRSSTLGLRLGYGDEPRNELLPRPFLSILPSSVVERGSNVTLTCQSHFQNVTFALAKLQDPRYKHEQRSAGNYTEFVLTHLQPKDAGTYFCAYRTMSSQEWSEESGGLWLEVADDRKGHAAPSAKSGTGITFVITFSCLSICLLFLSVVFIYRYTQQGESREEGFFKR